MGGRALGGPISSDRSVRRLISPFSRSMGLVLWSFTPMRDGEGHVGQHISLGLVEQSGELGQPNITLIWDMLRSYEHS
jgi:hypothetical protein